MSRWKIPEAVAWEAVGEQMVALRLADGRYFELNESAAMIYRLIGAGSDEEEIVELLCGEFEVTAERARNDLNQLANELTEFGLLSDS